MSTASNPQIETKRLEEESASDPSPLDETQKRKRESEAENKDEEEYTLNKGKRAHTRRNTDKPRGADPAPGSYAHPDNQNEFGINLDDVKEVTVKTNKRKVALLVSFVGSNYFGFQMNPKVRTLQGELELALYRSQLLSRDNFGFPHKYAWSNSARTDKGVHACAQVCSCKIEMQEGQSVSEVRDLLNSHLSDDISVLDVVRTTRAFCAKTQRDKVRYAYLLPSFLFTDPDQLNKLFNDHKIGMDEHGEARPANDPLSKEDVQKLKQELIHYRATPQQLQTLKDILALYQGTHPFHNFTKGIRSGDPSANRYILSFEVSDVVVDKHGVEWISCYVVGQSFLLHQIRKMVSLAVDVARGRATREFFQVALTKAHSTRLNLAPAQGLFLNMSYFDGYNRRKAKAGNQTDVPDLTWSSPKSDAYPRWEDFQKRILNQIFDEEHQEGNFIKYLYVQEKIFEHEVFYRLPEATDVTTKECS